MKLPHCFTSRLLTLMSAFILSAVTVAKAEGDPGAPALKALCEKLGAAVVAGDVATAAAITKGLLPGEDSVGKALSPAVPPEAKVKVLAFHAKLPRDDASLARLISVKPGQTVVQVHASSVKDLAAYAPDSVAFAEFPGGAQTLAKNGVLNPDVVFYTVEFLEPGKDAGMKYHLFYWDGGAWRMLGPIWRALQ
ncbi:MAG: hypothetical protein ACAI34_06120 [Verrucomicrobium sp.]